MIRLGDSGDWHLPEGQRFNDVLACLNYVVDDGIAQGVNLWAVKGDLTGVAVPHRSSILEMNTLDALFQRMAAHAPVILEYGNHDSPGDLDGYARLAAENPIYVVSEPSVFDVRGARIFALPYQWKRDWLHRISGTTIEEKDRAVEAALTELLQSWIPQRERATAKGMPTLFLAHGTIENAAIAGGEVLPPGHDIAFSIAAIEALGCDYSSASHFHLCQQMTRCIWLPGSPSRSNFGETDEKGYLVVDVEPGRPPIVHRRLTPARRFVTVDASYMLDRGDGRPGWNWVAPEVDGAEVRIRTTVPEAAMATADPDELTDWLRAAGAVDVKVDPRMIPKQEIRCAAIVEAKTLVDQVVTYWGQPEAPKPVDDAQHLRCSDKLGRLERGEIRAQREAA